MWTSRSVLALSLLSLLAVTLSGCTEDKPMIRGLSSGEAGELNAQRSPFDAAEDPTMTAETHFAAGQLAESQNAPQLALQQYRAALQLDAKHRPSHFALAMLLARLRQYPEAMAAWRSYIELTGGDAAGYSNLGFTHELAGQPQEAEAAYRKGIEADPANKPCRRNYGIMLARQGRVEEAQQQLQAAMPAALAHYNIGSVFEQQGKVREAKEQYEKALALDPKLEDAKLRLIRLRT